MHRGGEEEEEAEAATRLSTEGDAVGKVGVMLFVRGGEWASAIVWSATGDSGSSTLSKLPPLPLPSFAPSLPSEVSILS
jgi:hypothetical protein